MQCQNKISRFISVFSLSFAFSFLGILDTNAQCQDLLENLNKRNPFPTDMESGYLTCLATIESEYGKSIQKHKDLKREFDKWDSDLKKKNAELDKAKLNNDTVNINKLSLEVVQFEKDKNTSKDKLDSNLLQATTYYNLLSASYNSMKKYYEEIKENSSEAKKYEDKIRTLIKPTSS